MNYKALSTFTASILKEPLYVLSALTFCVGVANKDLESITGSLFLACCARGASKYLKNNKKQLFKFKQQAILDHFDKNYEGNKEVLVDDLWLDYRMSEEDYLKFSMAKEESANYVNLRQVANKQVYSN